MVDLARDIHVVVIDLLSCSSAVIAETVVQRLFEDETVVKVGYGLTQDVKALFRAACGSRWSARVSALETRETWSVASTDVTRGDGHVC